MLLHANVLVAVVLALVTRANAGPVGRLAMARAPSAELPMNTAASEVVWDLPTAASRYSDLIPQITAAPSLDRRQNDAGYPTGPFFPSCTWPDNGFCTNSILPGVRPFTADELAGRAVTMGCDDNQGYKLDTVYRQYFQRGDYDSAKGTYDSIEYDLPNNPTNDAAHALGAYGISQWQNPDGAARWEWPFIVDYALNDDGTMQSMTIELQASMTGGTFTGSVYTGTDGSVYPLSTTRGPQAVFTTGFCTCVRDPSNLSCLPPSTSSAPATSTSSAPTSSLASAVTTMQSLSTILQTMTTTTSSPFSTVTDPTSQSSDQATTTSSQSSSSVPGTTSSSSSVPGTTSSSSSVPGTTSSSSSSVPATTSSSSSSSRGPTSSSTSSSSSRGPTSSTRGTTTSTLATRTTTTGKTSTSSAAPLPSFKVCGWNNVNDLAAAIKKQLNASTDLANLIAKAVLKLKANVVADVPIPGTPYDWVFSLTQDSSNKKENCVSLRMVKD